MPSLPETFCRQFSLSEIKSATNNFSTDLIIGKGSYGNVYKGTLVLVSGITATVAVKRRKSDSKQGSNEFWTEVKLLSQCRHSNLISLIGYCVDEDENEMILVYEYMPNGTLADHIYRKIEKSVCLSWEQRLKICIGVGRGAEYLHTGTGIDQIVIHRDLKSSNILLDADWAAKISDFGLCKRCSGDRPYVPITASVKGTFAYMDPKYLTKRELSTKTDVYAVGVVLLEVLCGRRSLDFEVAERQKKLVLWAGQCFREGVSHRIVDPGLRGSLTDESLNIFLDVTLKCLQDRPKNRPTLSEVVGKLELALASQYNTYSASSSVDSEIFKHFNQVSDSSTSANSDLDPCRHTVEAGSTKSDTLKQDPGSESKSATIVTGRNKFKPFFRNNGLEKPIDLQSTQVKANMSIPATFETHTTWSNESYDEFGSEKLFRRLNPLSIVIDNKSCKNATVIQVNGINRQEVLLEVIQVLSDIDFIFTKASMTSDGLWSMNVFTVTDPEGKKVMDEKILDYIQKVLGSGTSLTDSIKSFGLPASSGLTVIELIGSDRPGLLSEVFTILTDLRCNVVNANVWTHNARAAFIIQLTDEESGTAITDPMRLYNIEKVLCSVLTVGSEDNNGAHIAVTLGSVNTERRLHQMMLADHDYERGSSVDLDESRRPDVNVVNWYHKDCSVVTIRCPDRPKLLFDTICTLTDMGYVVLHGHVNAEGTEAFQEYCIRHVDGSALKSEAERQRVIQCIKAAIERRVFEDLKLELCSEDRIGLLSDVTRIFRENNLMVTRAVVKTQGNKAVNTFYVCDASGSLVDSKIIHSVRGSIGMSILKVKHNPQDMNRTPQESPSRFLFPHFYNLGIKPLANIKFNFFS
ncbi:hypothetical protein SSX86_017655 [Deinandra increscens subsp. villosa]|uniref:ACT domain-containing protein ACR n=1 Tax=Deinandra increscens subsp. villosa TaxID=3103831 RepID=A0AAP0CZY7_9ASTR